VNSRKGDRALLFQKKHPDFTHHSSVLHGTLKWGEEAIFSLAEQSPLRLECATAGAEISLVFTL